MSVTSVWVGCCEAGPGVQGSVTIGGLFCCWSRCPGVSYQRGGCSVACPGVSYHWRVVLSLVQVSVTSGGVVLSLVQVFQVQRDALFNKSERQVAEAQLATVQKQMSDLQAQSSHVQELHKNIQESQGQVKEKDRKVGGGWGRGGGQKGRKWMGQTVEFNSINGNFCSSCRSPTCPRRCFA